MIKLGHIAFGLVAVTSCAASIVAADAGRVVVETELDAGIDEVWNAFTTKAGIESWMAPVAEIELTVGGKMRTNYNPKGKLGDETTIESTILSWDPKRMLSLKATGFPKGFPFEEAAKSTWSVFYFTPLTATRTRITVVGLGYGNDEQSVQMRRVFAAANQQALAELGQVLKSGRP